MYFADAVRKMRGLSFLVGEAKDKRLVCSDMDKTPHLLISGVTGSGKSVFLHSLLLSLMLHNRPENIRFVLCDSKVVELSQYNDIPHLLVPVITREEMVVSALRWVEQETSRRLFEFSKIRKRSLQKYNDYLWENFLSENGLPRIVFVIDDISAIASAEPDVLERIAQVVLAGRTAGIHLLLVAQNPTQKGVREIVKQIPSKVVFLTLTERESKFLIANSSACRLESPGGAIFSVAPGNTLPITTIMAEDDISESILSISIKSGANYDNSAIRFIERWSPPLNYMPKETSDELDNLIPQAVDIILDAGQASVSIIQRRLKLKYGSAARLMDRMEEQGIVGPFDGQSPRRILISKEQWDVFTGKG